MKAASVKAVRCAIYTRVSTEHGLDQEFNSLDAQYDAASAYIKSQAHAGWTLIRSRVCRGSRPQTGIPAAQPKISNYSNAKGRFTGACAVGLDAQGWPPGTEFLDAETGRQKSPPKWVNAGRDQNPGCEWPEIPAERPYLASYRKRAVCGDWMVV